MELKQYQSSCLEALREFFGQVAAEKEIAQAFQEIAGRNFSATPAYRKLADCPNLREIPYVCLRVPTGGGKTLMACHALGLAVREAKRQDSSLALWLVPSTTILQQTHKALANPRHPYFQALRQGLGDFTVKTVDEALYLSRGDLDGRTCIILSTLQAFRRDDTAGLRVYRENGALKGLVQGNEEIPGLERYEDGTVKRTLANVIALRRPVVIVDEAHNARTLLSFGVLDAFRPSCILEFTATPDTKAHPSNVLYSVSAQELKAEAMIKLPIAVEAMASGDWRVLLQLAINCRNDLEKRARLEEQTTGEYLRPILLLQAQRRSSTEETLHAERLREILVTDFRLPENQVKVATGEKREIDNVDLASRKCEVRYIITQQALKEGWDCPFAYILCSLAETTSAQAVEQLLGRVLRLPNVRRKGFEELNRAYAFVHTSFDQIAENLKDALVENGFQRFEAQQAFQQLDHGGSGSLGLFDYARLTADENGDFFQREITIPVPDPTPATPIPQRLQYKLEVRAEKKQIVLKGAMSAEDKKDLEAMYPAALPEIQKAYAQGLRGKKPMRSLSPAEQGRPFAVPQLTFRFEDEAIPFDETAFQSTPLDLAELDAALPTYRPDHLWLKSGKIDVTGQKITTEVASLREETQLHFAFEKAHNWTLPLLVAWLDAHIQHADIPGPQTAAFFTRALVTLTNAPNISLETLVRDRFHLAKVLENKLDVHRQACRQKAYQQFLLPECATPLEVTPTQVFSYGENYPVHQGYEGGYQFHKHYYPQIGAFDGKAGGEEEQCARFLDQLPEIEFWVRNLDSQPLASFWLQLHNRRFYPDFVCQLQDGRTLVVEYKGHDRYTNEDSREKRTIGELWAQRSHGHCLFVMTDGPDFAPIKQAITQL